MSKLIERARNWEREFSDPWDKGSGFAGKEMGAFISKLADYAERLEKALKKVVTTYNHWEGYGEGTIPKTFYAAIVEADQLFEEGDRDADS